MTKVCLGKHRENKAGLVTGFFHGSALSVQRQKNAPAKERSGGVRRNVMFQICPKTPQGHVGWQSHLRTRATGVPSVGREDSPV